MKKWAVKASHVGAGKSSYSSLITQQVAAWCLLGMGNLTLTNSWLDSYSASVSPPVNLEHTSKENE